MCSFERKKGISSSEFKFGNVSKIKKQITFFVDNFRNNHAIDICL